MNCKCGNVVRSIGQKNCKSCHSAYMRKWRPKHSELNSTQKLKSNCRAYANSYKKRGLLIQTPCVLCGSLKSEMHHENYNKPLAVIWLCRFHHLELHKIKSNSNTYRYKLNPVLHFDNRETIR